VHSRALLLLATGAGLFAADYAAEGKLWWAHIQFLADDKLEGRVVGSPGYLKAVQYVETQFDKLGPYFGAIQLRYFGRRPLIEDNSVTSKPTLLLSARAGYRLTEAVEVRLDIYNLFGSRSHQIDYFYASRLPGEPLGGVNDVHFHPVEPTSVRASLTVKL